MTCCKKILYKFCWETENSLAFLFKSAFNPAEKQTGDISNLVFLSFLGRGETESAWYIGH
jgi:hypothetical protein